MTRFWRLISKQFSDPTRRWSLVGTLSAAVAVNLVFQNCSEPVTGGGSQSSFADSLPFAFDTTVDTIAYMSCAGGPAASPQAIFSFKAGSYTDQSGMQLTNAFMTATRNYSVSQRAGLLSISPASSGAKLQLAIRQTAALQNVLTSGGGAAVEGEDVHTFLGPLDGGIVGSALAGLNPDGSERLGYITGGAGISGRTVEGAIHFRDNETEASFARQQLISGAGLLSITYPPARAEALSDARGPSGVAMASAYGRGYRLSFLPPPAENPASPQPIESESRVLGSVSEINLENGLQSGIEIRNWSCPTQLRFRIYRGCGLGCPCILDSDPGNPLPIAIRNQARRVLRPEHWYLAANAGGSCAVQKSTVAQCYANGSTGNFHFASLCTRQ